MKKLMYIFIPILAILLMSHNTYAVDVTYNAEDIWGNWTSQIMSNNWSIPSGCISPIISGQYYRRIFSTCEFTLNNLYVTIPNREYHADDLIMISFLLTYADESTSNHTTWFSNHYGGSNYLNLIDVDIENLNGNTQQVTLWLRAYGTFTDSNVLISGNDAPVVRLIPGTGGGNAAITPSVTQVWHINGNTAPSADDIADAVNEPEENAANDIENQDTSDIDTGDDSSATNLIGNINTLFTQIGNIQASDTCSVLADFGNLDLGNINFCTGKDKLPFVVTFGAYAFELIFVVGTAIILVKQVLGLFDWARS